MEDRSAHKVDPRGYEVTIITANGREALIAGYEPRADSGAAVILRIVPGTV